MEDFTLDIIIGEGPGQELQKLIYCILLWLEQQPGPAYFLHH